MTQIFRVPLRKTPNASQWNIGCFGYQTQNVRVGHVHFMLCVSISFALGGQRKRSFQWDMGLSVIPIPRLKPPKALNIGLGIVCNQNKVSLRQRLKPIFHSNAKPLILGPRLLHYLYQHVGTQNATAKPSRPNARPCRTNAKPGGPNASQWYIVCVRYTRVGFGLFIPFFHVGFGGIGVADVIKASALLVKIVSEQV